MHRATTYMERFCSPAAFSRGKKTTSTYLQMWLASRCKSLKHILALKDFWPLRREIHSCFLVCASHDALPLMCYETSHCVIILPCFRCVLRRFESNPSLGITTRVDLIVCSLHSAHAGLSGREGCCIIAPPCREEARPRAALLHLQNSSLS